MNRAESGETQEKHPLVTVGEWLRPRAEAGQQRVGWGWKCDGAEISCSSGGFCSKGKSCLRRPVPIFDAAAMFGATE